MKHLLSYTFIIALLFSCTNNAQKDRTHETLDASSDTIVSFYDLFTSLEIIPLETTDSSILNPRTVEFIINDETFYVLDDKQMLVMTFDKTGKYITTINKKGQGPGEYKELYDFAFNPFTGNLELLDPHSGINIYNKDNYKFIKRINKPKQLPALHRFSPLTPNEYLLFCGSNDGNKMAIYNIEKEEITSDFYDVPQYLLFNTFYHHTYSPFYILDDKVHFIQGYDGKVFTLENNQLSEKYCWDFGPQNFKLENLPADKDIRFYFNWDKTVGKNYATCFVKYAENSKYYMTQYRFNGKNRHLIYNKEDKNTFIFTAFQEGNFSTPTIMDENFAYSIVIPQLLEYHMNPNLLDEKGKEIFKNIQEDDNPIILKYKFKK